MAHIEPKHHVKIFSIGHQKLSEKNSFGQIKNKNGSEC